MRQALAHAPFQYCGTHAAAGWQFIMLDSYDPGHVGGRLDARELERLDRSAGQLARARDGVLASSSDRHGQPLARHRRSRQRRRFLAGDRCARSRSRRRMGPRAPGIRRQARQRAACSRRRRPARNSCPKSDRYAIDSRPPAYRLFRRCTPTGAFDSEIRWVEARPLRQAAAATLIRRARVRHANAQGSRPRSSTAGTRPLRLLLGAVLARRSAPWRTPTPPQHSLWELHGKHNTVYVLGSIHVLRAERLPARARGARCVPRLEVAHSWRSTSTKSTPSRRAIRDARERHACPRARPCPKSWGRARYARAQSLAREVGVELVDVRSIRAVVRRRSHLAAAADAARLRAAAPGVEMYFLGRARTDGKSSRRARDGA